MSPADQPIAIGLLVVSALAFVVWITDAARRARRDRHLAAHVVTDPACVAHDPRRVDEARGVPCRVCLPFEPTEYLADWECRVYGCARPASVWVITNGATAHTFVCRKCAHEGAALGWWTLAAS